ncbi:MAG: glycosyltransferase family 4 protein [Bacteroidia bacterium]|nr:glycosyltransferase family 4 protein [Bacteroidia bacterium]MCZ2277225.1 glycosyltransferase family 4 protein [Bacteroidia bacterium]
MTRPSLTVTVVDPVGVKAGMDIYNLQLLRALADSGNHCCLFSNFNSTSDQVEIYNVFKNSALKGWRSGFAILVGLLKSLLQLKKRKADWVICHLFRGDLLELVTNMLFFFGGFKICLIVHDIESLDTKQSLFIKKIALNRFFHIRIVHNRFSFEELKKISTESSNHKTHIIPHGNFSLLPQQVYSRKEALQSFGWPEENKYLLFFGQLKKVKGVDILLDAFSKAKTDFVLVIAGKERNESLEQYKNITEKLKHEKRLYTLIRHITDCERSRLFQLADLVILPYKHIYQSGVLLMAMSLGKATLVSDLPPFVEIIEDRVNGIIFKSGNCDSLKSEIENLSNLNLEEIGHQAKIKADNQFNWHAIADQYLRILY